MSYPRRTVAALPSALDPEAGLEARLAGQTPAVFLDYDGTLAPIVDRPEEAVISAEMRETVRRLAAHLPVCVVSGRDRRVVQDLMGLDHLIVAGSHGFDIWSPDEGTIELDAGGETAALLGEVERRLRRELDEIEGALVEPKKVAVAAHYRRVPERDRDRVRRVVEAILADHPDALKCTPGKMVWEIQPAVDWDKGKAVRYLLDALDLDREDVVPLYLGDDITDEDAFRALDGVGIGILVGHPDDPELGDRPTRADYALRDVEEVGRFLDLLVR